jgi:ABC-type uncharacterized transport system permease subunit
MILTANIIAIFCYLLVTAYQGHYLLDKRVAAPSLRWIFVVGAIAAAAHGVSVLLTIYPEQRLDMGVSRALSLIFWFISTISLLNLLRRPTTILLALLFPLAALSIAASSWPTPIQELDSAISIGMLTHILSSILAYSLLTIAAIQALILTLQIRALKQHYFAGILRAMPPLQTMEQMLFELIWVGMLLLSISLLSGTVFIEDIFAQHLVHKTVLSIAAWLIFAVLLWGRNRFGWRNIIAARWTLSGFIILMFSYIGSKLVLELLL